MNISIISIFVGSVLIAAAASSQDWINFKVQHGKTYKSRSEDVLRRRLFEQTLERIDKHNSDPSKGYKLGLTKFADWTEAERQIVNGYKAPAGYFGSTRASGDDVAYIDSLIEDGKPIPKRVDWRKVPGRVSQVKDQKLCGSCWAFATTGGLEGLERTRGKSNLTALSEQNLIDCPEEDKYELFGCDGGQISPAMSFIKDQQGIVDEISYPYEAVKGNCRFSKANVAATDAGFAGVPQKDEVRLEKLVAKYGPVAVAMNAVEDLADYKSGIYDGDCDDNPFLLNHAVLIVGYGEDEATSHRYWIIKNSWGESFGEKGYFRLSRRRKNACGICNDANIPRF